MKEGRKIPRQKKGKRIQLLMRIALLLTPALVYLPGILKGVPFPPGDAGYTDLLISHYPNLVYLKGSLMNYRQLPLWSTLVHSGAPFAANPLAGIYYLPGWLAMFLPLPAGISFVAAAHSVFGAWGMYLFLRQLDAGERGSLVGGLSFGLMPKLAAHFGAGHISLIYALAWTPWLFAVSRRDEHGYATGIIAGMLFLADPRWAVYAGSFWAIYKIAYRHFSYKRLAVYFLKAAGTGLLVAAPLILPLLEYIPLSTRAGMSTRDTLALSLPAGQLLGLFIPVSGSSVEWYLYSGGFVLTLTLLLLVNAKKIKSSRFWLAGIAVSILLALSPWQFLGMGSWIGHIPGLSLLRVPARSLFLTGFCFAVSSGLAIDYFWEQTSNSRIIRLTASAVVAFAFLMSGILSWEAGGLKGPIIWGFASLFLAGLVFLAKPLILSTRTGWRLITALLVFDLLGAGLQAYQIKTDYSRAEPILLDVLVKDKDIFRVYSPSYSLAQNEAAINGLEMADGVDPLQIAAYFDYMVKATGVESSRYSVSIPPFATGNPEIDNAGSLPNMELLGLLNVKYVLAEFPLDEGNLILVASSGNQFLYLNTEYQPRVWIEDPGQGRETTVKTEVEVLYKSPNLILLEAQGPGRMVLSEIGYPGWKAYIDRESIEIIPAHSVLRSVQIPAGPHKVLFVYRPLSVYLGLVLAVIGWGGALFMVMREKGEKVHR